MRIFLTLSPSGNSSVPGSMTWYRNLYEPLLDLGHDVYLFRLDLFARERRLKRRTEEFKREFSQGLLKTFTSENGKKKFDFFLSYLVDSEVDTACLDQIRRTGVPTANFSCNNVPQFYLVRGISPHFDYNLHSEKSVADKFVAVGARPVWFPMAANPRYYHPVSSARNTEVIFVGGCYAKRATYLWDLLENGIDVHVYGPGWRHEKNLAFLRRIKREITRDKQLLSLLFTSSADKRARMSSQIADLDFKDRLIRRYENNLHFPLTDEGMIRKYSESKISLGFLEVYDNHHQSGRALQYLHLREFEAPMCGALYMTNYSDELAEFYEPDKEVVVFRNEHELIDKAKFYLNNEAAAEKIRRSGRERALRCHTYQERFAGLFKELGLGNSGYE